ncbi:ArsR family transcriptional regulator [Cohnella sp. CFH 77786]|nr:ArsR family transcriptional regulator [Cohnella sp. CFH 77786]
MKATTSPEWLPLYEALASEVRLKMIDLLAVQPMNNKDLAARLNISGAIVTSHIRKLQAAGIVESRMVRIQGGTHKMNTLSAEGVELLFPAKKTNARPFHEVSIPVGHYTRFEIHPTCGLATPEKMIGQFDEPRSFHDPQRMAAGILWFGRGFVEYTIPNYLLSSQNITEIEISMEIGSEAPGIAENWPSDIHFHLNDTFVGYWTSPGDSGNGRGIFSPDWWSSSINQYGFLKMLRIGEEGTFIDGEPISAVTLNDLKVDRNSWKLRFSVEETAKNVGGFTLYGAGFGNYNQDIVFRTYYE